MSDSAELLQPAQKIFKVKSFKSMFFTTTFKYIIKKIMETLYSSEYWPEKYDLHFKWVQK